MGLDTFQHNTVDSGIGSCYIREFIGLPVTLKLIRCCEVMFEMSKVLFWRDSSEMFMQLSVAHKQTGGCNCFPNCLFEQWLTQLVLGLCLLQYHCLTVAPHLCDYFKLTLAVNYICICNVSASMISLLCLHTLTMALPSVSHHSPPLVQ